MTLTVKNWSKFQHFRDRRPPWIKLYRDILDDIDWHNLDPNVAKSLVMLWLIASEDEGRLPSINKIAFRLRVSESEAKSIVSKLSHWLYQSDDTLISDRYQDDAPERERETEGETETEGERETETKPPKKRRAPKGADVPSGEFLEWYAEYPRHTAKPTAWSSYTKALKKVDAATLLAGAKRARIQYADDEQKYIPMPATWLNQERWLDEMPKSKADQAEDDLYATVKVLA